MVAEYVRLYFGETLRFAEGPSTRGILEVAFVSEVQGNGLADWQNSTMLAVLKDSSGQRLWTGEYTYKGGWEMSGWRVATATEAAKLVTQRLSKRFQQDVGSQ